MYSIRIRTNHRLDEYQHGDSASIGVRLKSGNVRFYIWGGFTLDVIQPVKTIVESFTLEDEWDPRNSGSKMPRWSQLDKGEFLLGSYDGRSVFTVLPFRIV